MRRDRRPQAERLLSAGISAFVLGMAVCIAIEPAGLRLDFGISYYGTRLATVAPFSAGILGFALAGWLSARAIADQAPDLVTWSLQAFSVLLVGVVLTPYSAGPLFDAAHTWIGSIAFVIALGETVFIVVDASWRADAVVLLCVMLVAGWLCAHWVPMRHGWLIEAQFVYLGCWAIALTGYLRRLGVTVLELGAATTSG
jgi:hypothetical protein